MDPGVAGVDGLSVPGLVVEELRPSVETAIVLPPHMVVETVVEVTLNKASVTLALVKVR